MINVEFCPDLKKAIFGAIGRPKKTRHGMSVYWNIGAGFDCETTQTPKKYAYVYIWQFSINKETFIGRSCNSFYEFAKILDNCLRNLYYRGTHKKPKQFPQLLVYIANMGYEWSFFKTKFNELGISKTFAKEPRKPLSIRVGECLEFRECLGLWGNSLKEIGENYTTTKKLTGDLQFKDADGNFIQRNSKTRLTREELGYCINDVQILSELGMITFDKFHKRPIPYTNTGIIRNDVKTRMQAKGNLYFEGIKEAVKRIYPHNLREYQIAMRKLFCGGLTHSNYKYIRKDDDGHVVGGAQGGTSHVGTSAPAHVGCAFQHFAAYRLDELVAVQLIYQVEGVATAHHNGVALVDQCHGVGNGMGGDDVGLQAEALETVFHLFGGRIVALFQRGAVAHYGIREKGDFLLSFRTQKFLNQRHAPAQITFFVIS